MVFTTLKLQNYSSWSCHLSRMGLWRVHVYIPVTNCQSTREGTTLHSGSVSGSSSQRGGGSFWMADSSPTQTSWRHHTNCRNSGRPQPLSFLRMEWMNRVPPSGWGTSKLNSMLPCWLCHRLQIEIENTPRRARYPCDGTTQLSPPRKCTPRSFQVYITEVTLSVEAQDGTTTPENSC